MPSLLLVALWALPGVDAQVTLLEGPPVAGALTSISPDKVVVASAGGPVEIAARQILQVELVGRSLAAPPAGSRQITMVDGSSLWASQYTVAAGMATIVTTSNVKFEARTRSVQWVRLKDPSPQFDKAWEEIVPKQATGDLLVVRTKGDDGVQGLDFLEGIVEEINATHVVFNFDGEKNNVSLTRVEGIVYFHAEKRDLPAPAAELSDVGGSRWAAKDFAVQGQQMEVTTLAGIKATIPLAALARLDFSSGKLVRLADLPYELQRWSLPPDAGVLRTLPSAQALFGPRRDRWAEGEAGLSLAYHENEQEKIKTVPDGLALRANTTLLYRLPTGSRRFTAIAGVDASVESAGEIKLVLVGDSQTLYDGTLSRSRDPVSLDLDLTGVKRLQIRVERAPPLDMIHRLNLVTPRIWK